MKKRVITCLCCFIVALTCFIGIKSANAQTSTSNELPLGYDEYTSILDLFVREEKYLSYTDGTSTFDTKWYDYPKNINFYSSSLGLFSPNRANSGTAGTQSYLYYDYDVSSSGSTLYTYYDTSYNLNLVDIDLPNSYIILTIYGEEMILPNTSSLEYWSIGPSNSLDVGTYTISLNYEITYPDFEIVSYSVGGLDGVVSIGDIIRSSWLNDANDHLGYNGNSNLGYIYLSKLEIVIDCNQLQNVFSGSSLSLRVTDVQTQTNSQMNFVNFNEYYFGKPPAQDFDVDFTSWISNAVTGFLDTDIIGFFSIADILMVILAIGLTIMIIKFFMGG